ncbi:MAG: hypothetical protein QNJ16_05450 [Rhodobacter sp.]|nr:hypothetical protein [Rhodobacter sp.]
MKIAGTDTEVRDLTRWNRAGLSRFRYIEGGAAEWVEYLRIAHLLLFARNLQATSHDDPDAWRSAVETGQFDDELPIEDALAAIQSSWRQPTPWSFVDDNADYRTALRAQYDRIPLDQTAQISRAFARAFHILTETLDAYANEGFLATATQAPHLRRLLELIDFEPRLAASAQVPIALSIVDDTPRQTIERGLAVEYLPSDGNPILTFESLNPQVVEPGLNLMRAAGWDQRSDPVPASQSVFEIADTSVLTIALAGHMAVLSQGNAMQGALVDAADKSAGTVTLDRGPGGFVGTMQSAEMLLAPAEVHPARPIGSTWLNFAATPDVYVGQVVSLSTDSTHVNNLTWYVDAVAQTELIKAKSVETSPVVTEALTSTASAIVSVSGNAKIDAALNGITLIGNMIGFVFGNTATVLEVRGRDVRINRSKPSGLKNVFPAVRSVIPQDDTLPIADQIPVLGPYITPQDAEPVGDLVTLDAGRVHIDAPSPEGLADGDPMAVKLKDGAVAAAEFADLSTDEDGFDFVANLPSGYGADDVSEIAFAFGAKSGLVHEYRSDAELFPAAMNSALDLEVTSDFDDLLKPGRVLLVAPDPDTATDDDAGQGMALTIATAERLADDLRLTFEEDLSDLSDFRIGHTVIYGNVLAFGHGKSLPEKVLGSGDGSVSGQVMTLPASDIATLPDPSFPGGAVPDIEITASGRKLRVVARAEDADLLQPSYLVRLAEDGSAEAVFLSRLSTEADGVRLTRFRQGSGQVGNSVPPFAITKPTPKNPIIGAMMQPLAPQLGADLQDAAALKSQGNSHFALMDRALSARDFARLAESSTSVWHAHADLVREAGSQGRPTIVLTIVPAGGGSVEPVRDDLEEFLLTRALPGTALTIQPYRPAPVTGSASVTLKKGFAQDVTVLEELQQSLFAAFSLEARELGRTLYVTEMTALLEAHEAVDYLVFTLTPAWPALDPPRVITSASDAIQAVIPAPTQTVYVEAPEDIEIEWSSGDNT